MLRNFNVIHLGERELISSGVFFNQRISAFFEGVLVRAFFVVIPCKVTE